MESDDLKQKERSTFRTAVDIGLWDVLIASVVASFAIAPMLSGTLGDFWSSVIFLPIWAGIYLIIRFIKEHVVVHRIGVVQFGSYRRRRLRRFLLVMVAVNTAALVLGTVIAVQPGAAKLGVYPIVFSLIVLIAFSLAAYFLHITRFFLYGVLLAMAPLVGEALFRRGSLAHHGYPVVYGIAAGTIATVGLVKFTLLVLSRHPVVDGPPAAGTDD